MIVGNGKGITILNLEISQYPLLPNFHLKHVLYTLKISKKLISVNRLCTDNNAFIEFHSTFFLVKDQLSKKVLMQEHLEQGLYKLINFPGHYNSFEAQTSSNTSSPTSVFLSQNESSSLWHERLGHLFRVLL